MLPKPPVVCRPTRRRSPSMANRAHIPKRFSTAGIIIPFPLRSDETYLPLLVGGDAARRAAVKSGRRTTTGPAIFLKKRQPEYDRTTHERKRTMPDETTFELVSLHFG